MKHLYNLTLGLAAAAAMSLASCADDVAAPGVPGQDGEGVWMSIDVSRGSDPASRLTHTEDANGLNVAWEQDDYIYVFDLNSERLIGKLDYVKTVTDDSEGCTASFAGQLTSAPTGTVSIFYAGKDANGTRRIITDGQDLEISYASQAGSFDAMAYNDVMTNPSVSVTVNNGQATSANTVEMSHACAFAHFKTDLDANTVVTVNVPQSYTTYNIKANGGFAPSSRAADFTATVQDGGDLYIAMLLVNGKPEISFTAGGKTVTLPAPSVDLKTGNYYRAGWDTTTGSEGIPVNFNTDPAPAVDHSKNPLLKWAEGDLVYNKSTRTSSVASSHLTRGSFYQWGLNTGYENYIDARGNLNSYLYNYVTYGQQYWTGTGVTYGYIHRSRFSYSSKTDIKTANDNGLFIMNPPKNPDANNPLKYDYWLSSFGDGGSTWQERADAVGINMTLIPTGYRLPTQADFQEIMPSERILSSSTLTSTLNSNSEIRTNNNCSYAIKWTAERINSRIYLRIDALVVPSTTTNVNNVNWNDSNVKTRYFGGNGGIHAFYHLNYGTYNYYYYYEFPVARPMPAIETHMDIPKILSNGDIYVLWNNVVDHSVNNEGYYWMSDKKGAFYFSDNSNWSGSFSNRQSVVGYQNVSPQDCCTIRCIDTSKE